MNINQPAVSQHVRALECRFGWPIVVKFGRGVRFTDEGEELLDEARRLFVAHDESLRRLRLPNDSPIVIGSTEHAADSVLPRLLSSLNGAFPVRRVKFRLDRSMHLLDDVRMTSRSRRYVDNPGSPPAVGEGRVDVGQRTSRRMCDVGL
ncbi:LysR family transcriptional regulator [Rhodococcus globerulus]|uniref:LysR family transcriptional regulator n=1 Tax=Rhodococcus globerulus TaxID=33008 RepID=UPI00374EB94F